MALALVAALLGVLVPAAGAVAVVPAGTQQVALGDVVATVSWGEGEYAVEDPRLQIVRAGVVEFDEGVTDVCEGCTFFDGALRVLDLDLDGEPEVLLDAFTGGAHCCTVTGIYDRRPATSGYDHVVRDWGNVGYALQDLDGDGRSEFRSADDRFAYTFSAYAFGGFPVQIWGWQTSPRVGLVDVTHAFPERVRRDAAGWLAVLRRARRGDDVRGVLAAYVADMYRLGQGKAGRAEVARQRSRSRLGTRRDGIWPGGSKYEPALLKFLRTTGYR